MPKLFLCQAEGGATDRLCMHNNNNNRNNTTITIATLPKAMLLFQLGDACQELHVLSLSSGVTRDALYTAHVATLPLRGVDPLHVQLHAGLGPAKLRDIAIGI
jgi:hypothetical protein